MSISVFIRHFLLVLMFLSALLSKWAEASVIDSDNFYAVDIQYNSVAYGKPVASVLAHVGVEERHPDFLGKPMMWEDVTDVNLSESNGSFIGKVGLRASGYSGSISSILTPVIQYFVSFKDGSSLISDVYPVSFDGSEQFSVYYESDAQKFINVGRNLVTENVIPSATRVVLTGTIWGWGTPSDRLTECLQKSTVLTVYAD